MKTLIKFWKAKDTWLQSTVDFRIEYASQMKMDLQSLESKGVLIEEWGVNTDSSAYIPRTEKD